MWVEGPRSVLKPKSKILNKTIYCTIVPLVRVQFEFRAFHELQGKIKRQPPLLA